VRDLPEGIESGEVVEALRRRWKIDVDVAEYAPLGGGSYHWEIADRSGRRWFATVDDLDHKAGLGDTRTVVLEALRHAFDTSVALRERGLNFVLAPILTSDGESLSPLDERYTIALFPFVAGEPGTFGRYDDDEDRLGVLALIAQLHLAAPVPATATVGFELPGRHHLETALLELDEPWSVGPLSEQARQAVRECRSELTELLALADRLSAAAQANDEGWVLTHGEPHGGNVMRTNEGRLLVDWDTVAVAPPERDLWMLVSDRDEGQLYVGATGRRIDEAALDFFRLTWDLKDFAEYLNVLRSPHHENEDTVRQCGALSNCAAIRETWAALLG
jgi:spectinomycin phosphotransferase